MTLSDVREEDNGEWECHFTGKLANGDSDTGTGKVQVTVAVPPSEVYLRANEQRLGESIQMNLDEQEQMYVDCVATGARPAVEFNWYIGETKLNAHIKLSEEEGEDGKKTYISTLQFSPAPKHDGEELKCEAVHQGYSVQAIADEANWAKAQIVPFEPSSLFAQLFKF